VQLSATTMHLPRARFASMTLAAEAMSWSGSV
jgi:hypothetical protein